MMCQNPLSCKLCRAQYNTIDKRPRCFMPCGHTFCDKCISGLLEKLCPKCKTHYNQAIVDYEVIDLIKKAQKIRISKKEPDILNNQLRPEIIHLINEGTRDQILIGLKSLRNLLSKENNPPIQEVINAGLVERLVELLESKHNTIIYESTWALTNITSGDTVQTQYVVKAGVIPKLVKLISSTNLDTCENAIWTLGNIAGDNSECRDLVIENKALEAISNVLLEDKNNKQQIKFKKNGIWALSNFCRNKAPLVDLKKIECILPVFSVFINNTDLEILTNVCWAVFYLTDGPNERIDFVIKNFDITRFVELTSHFSEKVRIPALRIIGNIVTGNDVQTQCILNCKGLASLNHLTKSVNSQIRKDACWAISNITAGTTLQIQEVIDSNIFPEILKIIKNDQDNQVKKEAIWIFGNALSCGSNAQIKYLYEMNILPFLCKLVNSNDADIVQISLDSILSLITYSFNINNQEITNQISSEFEALKQIEKLTKSSQKSVFEKAVNIINTLKRKEVEV